jgi:hypothetical protein
VANDVSESSIQTRGIWQSSCSMSSLIGWQSVGGPVVDIEWGMWWGWKGAYDGMYRQGIIRMGVIRVFGIPTVFSPR